jgi:hypothetical protein
MSSSGLAEKREDPESAIGDIALHQSEVRAAQTASGTTYGLR